jgi:putative transposase
MQVKCYKYRIYPTDSQEKIMLSHIETCREFYNSCLSERKESYEQEQKSVSLTEQNRHVKYVKDSIPEANGIHTHVLQNVVADLDKAFKAFFRRVKSGEKPGYPRFKGFGRFDSFGFKEYGNGFKIDGRRLRMFGIGRVAVRWHRKMLGKVKSMRIVRKAGKWFASFSCEVEAKPLESTGEVIGIDVGIKSLLTLSNSETIENPKWYRDSEKKLRKAQRSLARKKKGGSNRRKQIRQVQTVHLKTQNKRRDFINKVANSLIMRFDGIALEDLQIKNLVRNGKLSKSILDAGWGYLLSRLQAKAECAARTIELVNPAYTSKTCSNCGIVFENLKLSDRWIKCECGLSLDRDHNAAINILSRSRLGQSRLEIT